MTPRKRREAYVTPQQAAEAFAAAGHPITPRHVSRLYDAGKLTGYRRPSGYRRIRRDSVERYLKAKSDIADKTKVRPAKREEGAITHK